MSQHDYNIANQGFPAFRTDLNNALSAIQTTNSGTSRPTGAVAGQLWLDTTTATSPTLKYYDGADDISLATIDHTANTVNWLDSTVSITGLTTTATGTVLTLSDSANTTTVNLIIDNDKEIRFREATANGTNYVALKAPASVSADVTYTLPVAPTVNNQALISTTAGVMAFTPYTFPTSDGSANQVLKTNGSGVLSFSTISASGDYARLATSTISANTTAVTFDGYFTSDYDTYLIYGNNILLDGNGNVGIRYRQSSADVTTNNYFAISVGATSADNGLRLPQHPTTSPYINGNSPAFASNEGFNFLITIFDPNNNQGTRYKMIRFESTYQSTTGYMEVVTGVLINTQSTAVLSGFKILPTTGNFDAGTIVLYGVKKS